jgi:hypothetical protein
MELRPLAHAVRTDRPVYGLQARALDSQSPPDMRVERMAEEYLRCIRQVQPNGPYAIVGFSFGGLIALEMAQRLRREGETVELLALLDTYVHESRLPLTARKLLVRSPAICVSGGTTGSTVYARDGGRCRGPWSTTCRDCRQSCNGRAVPASSRFGSTGRDPIRVR